MLKLSILIAFILFALPSAHAQTPFYQGKTLTIVHGRAAGGSGDLRVRAVAPFLQKYLPGNPNVRARIHGRRRRAQSGQSYLQ